MPVQTIIKQTSTFEWACLYNFEELCSVADDIHPGTTLLPSIFLLSSRMQCSARPFFTHQPAWRQEKSANAYYLLGGDKPFRLTELPRSRVAHVDHYSHSPRQSVILGRPGCGDHRTARRFPWLHAPLLPEALPTWCSRRSTHNIALSA